MILTYRQCLEKYGTDYRIKKAIEAGILFQKGWLKARKISLCIYGFLATVFIYGGIMNPASLVMTSYAITKRNLLAIYMSGLPVDLVHASATVIFLWIASKPMIEKLERIKVKYGMMNYQLPCGA